MSRELSELNFAQDFEVALGVSDATRWHLTKAGPLKVWATMSPAAKPEESFQAQLLWRVYPEEPPSLKFRDPASGRVDLPHAWPQVRGFRPGTLDACVTWCLEGMGLHPEWRTDPRFLWDIRGNVLLRVLRTLQEELDEQFQGRHP
jgi:hypothetical protein